MFAPSRWRLPALFPLSAREAIAVFLTVAWLLLWRALLATPWGFSSASAGDGWTNVGIVTNALDTWSYLSWCCQYYHGAQLAGLLFTSEPHAELLWLFPLWAIGKLAAWTGWSVLGTYNAAGAGGAAATVFFLLRAGGAFSLPGSARHWAALALVLGSGGSWLSYVAEWLGAGARALGGDLYFLDLFPSTAFVAYAYHSLGLALLAGLWWTATEWETRRLAGRASVRGWLAALAFAALLGFSRPYEPIAFLAAWFLKVAWHGGMALCGKEDRSVWRNAAWVGGGILLALAPSLGWSAWVTTQPVWSNFAHSSLQLGMGRTAWLWALVGWIVLAGMGVEPSYRANRRLAALPIAASTLLAIVLLGFGSAHTKLASGLMLGPILLSGWGAARIVAAAKRSRLPRILQGIGSAVALGALLGVPSFFLNVAVMAQSGSVVVENDLIALAQRLPFRAGEMPPVVLTDARTGGILPGLVGARVWVGHWTLSPHYLEKVHRLEAAGLNPASPPVDAAQALRGIGSILAETKFDYALIDRRCAPAVAALEGWGWHSIDATPRWHLLGAPNSVRDISASRRND